MSRKKSLPWKLNESKSLEANSGEKREK